MALPRIILTPAQKRVLRKRAYDVGNAAVLLAVAYGLANDEKAAAWGFLLNALLGMASKNVPDGARDFYLEED